jgi:hypothetical protein
MFTIDPELTILTITTSLRAILRASAQLRIENFWKCAITKKFELEELVAVGGWRFPVLWFDEAVL